MSARRTNRYLSSFIFLQTSVVCPVFESILVVAGTQLQVTVLAFSWLTTTQCSMVSAVGGGNWLRMGGGGGGAAATGCFFAPHPASRDGQSKSMRHTFLMPLFSLSPACLSMAILVTGHKEKAPLPAKRARNGAPKLIYWANE